MIQFNYSGTRLLPLYVGLRISTRAVYVPARLAPGRNYALRVVVVPQKPLHIRRQVTGEYGVQLIWVCIPPDTLHLVWHVLVLLAKESVAGENDFRGDVGRVDVI